MHSHERISSSRSCARLLISLLHATVTTAMSTRRNEQSSRWDALQEPAVVTELLVRCACARSEALCIFLAARAALLPTRFDCARATHKQTACFGLMLLFQCQYHHKRWWGTTLGNQKRYWYKPYVVSWNCFVCSASLKRNGWWCVRLCVAWNFRVSRANATRIRKCDISLTWSVIASWVHVFKFFHSYQVFVCFLFF